MMGRMRLLGVFVLYLAVCMLTIAGMGPYACQQRERYDPVHVDMEMWWSYTTQTGYQWAEAEVLVGIE